MGGVLLLAGFLACGVALADGFDIGGDLVADGGDGVGYLSGSLFEDTGQIKIDDILTITVHGRVPLGWIGIILTERLPGLFSAAITTAAQFVFRF